MFWIKKLASAIVASSLLILSGGAEASIGQKNDCLMFKNKGAFNKIGGVFKAGTSSLWGQQKPAVGAGSRGAFSADVWRKWNEYNIAVDPSSGLCNIDRDDNYIIQSGDSLTISGDVEVGNMIVEEGGELILAPGSRLNLNRTADPIDNATYNSGSGSSADLLDSAAHREQTLGLLHVKGNLTAAGAVVYEGEIVSVTYMPYGTNPATDGIQLVLDPAPRNLNAGFSMYLRVLDDDPESLTSTLIKPVQIGEGTKNRDEARASYAKWRQYKVWAVSGSTVTLAYNEHENINLGTHRQGSSVWQDTKFNLVGGGAGSSRCINGATSFPDVALGTNAQASGLQALGASASAESCFGSYVGQRGVGHTTTAAPENVNATWEVTNTSHGLYSRLELDQANNMDRYALNDLGKAYVRWNGSAASGGAAKASCAGKHAKLVGIHNDFNAGDLADLNTPANRHDHIFVSGDVTECNGVQWEFTDGLRAGDRVAGISAAIIRGNVREKATGVDAAAILDWESNFRGFNGRIAIDHKTAVVNMEHVVIRYIDALNVCAGDDCWIKEIPEFDSNSPSASPVGDQRGWSFSGLPMSTSNQSTSSVCVVCIYNSDPGAGNKASESSYRWVDIGFVHSSSVGPARNGALFGLLGINKTSGHTAKWNVTTLWDVTGMKIEYLYLHDVIVGTGTGNSLRGWNPEGLTGGTIKRSRIERTDGSQYSEFNFNPININGLDADDNPISCPTCKGTKHKGYHVVVAESKPEVVTSRSTSGATVYNTSSACLITYDYDADVGSSGTGRNKTVAAYNKDSLNTGSSVYDFFGFGCSAHAAYTGTQGGTYRNLVIGGPTDFNFDKGVHTSAFKNDNPNKVYNSIHYGFSGTRGAEGNESRTFNNTVSAGYLHNSVVAGSPGPFSGTATAPYSNGLYQGKIKNWKGVFAISGGGTGMFRTGSLAPSTNSDISGAFLSIDYSDSVWIQKDLTSFGPIVRASQFTGDPYGNGLRSLTLQNNYIVGGNATSPLLGDDFERFHRQCANSNTATGCLVHKIDTVDGKTQVTIEDNPTNFAKYPLLEGQQVTLFNLPGGGLHSAEVYLKGNSTVCGASDGTYDYNTWASTRHGLASGSNAENDVKGQFTMSGGQVVSATVTDSGSLKYKGSPLVDVRNSPSGATSPVSGNTSCQAYIHLRGGMSELELIPDSNIASSFGGGGYGKYQGFMLGSSAFNSTVWITQNLEPGERLVYRRSLFTLTNIEQDSVTDRYTFNLKWAAGADAGKIVNILNGDSCEQGTASLCENAGNGNKRARMISGYGPLAADKLTFEMKDSTVTYSDTSSQTKVFWDTVNKNTGKGAFIDGPSDAGRNITNTLVVAGNGVGGWNADTGGNLNGIGPGWDISSGSVMTSNLYSALGRAYIVDPGSGCAVSGDANDEIVSTLTLSNILRANNFCTAGCFGTVGGGDNLARFKGRLSGGVLVDAWVQFGGSGYTQDQDLTLASGNPAGLSCTTYPVVKATVIGTSPGIVRGIAAEGATTATAGGATPARLRDFMYEKSGGVLSTSRPRTLGLSAMAVSHALLGDFFVEQWENFSSAEYVSPGGGGGGDSAAW